MTSQCLPAQPSSFFARWLWCRSVESTRSPLFSLSLFHKSTTVCVLSFFCTLVFCSSCNLNSLGWASVSKQGGVITLEELSQINTTWDIILAIDPFHVYNSEERLSHPWWAFYAGRGDTAVGKGFRRLLTGQKKSQKFCVFSICMILSTHRLSFFFFTENSLKKFFFLCVAVFLDLPSPVCLKIHFCYGNVKKFKCAQTQIKAQKRCSKTVWILWGKLLLHCIHCFTKDAWNQFFLTILSIKKVSSVSL